MTTHDNLLQLNQLPENNKNPIAESNNDYDISMDIETRIAELRTCPVWEHHVRMLEDLLRKADELASKFYNDDVETTLKLQKAEAEVERMESNKNYWANLWADLSRESIKRAEKAEVERMESNKNYWANLWADLSRESIKRAEKAEAEVERLREQLQQAVDIAEWYMDNLVQSPRKDKLEAIKATLNADKK